MKFDHYICEGQMNLDDFLTSNEEAEEKPAAEPAAEPKEEPDPEVVKEEPQKKLHEDIRQSIITCQDCDVEFGSLTCFERRGFMYDRAHREWIRNEAGQQLRTEYDKRACKLDFDFVPDIAENLKKHCERWGYDWIEKISFFPKITTFWENVCKITKTHYFHVNEDFYGIEYNRKLGIGTVYKCGKEEDCLKPLCDVPIDSIIAKIRIKGECKWCKRFNKHIEQPPDGWGKYGWCNCHNEKVSEMSYCQEFEWREEYEQKSS